LIYLGGREYQLKMNFLTDPLDRRSTFRSANVMVYEWVGVKHASVDLVGV